ncbi:hypothetical protein ACLB2K_031775 [Fragaria x ananassa]
MMGVPPYMSAESNVKNMVARFGDFIEMEDPLEGEEGICPFLRVRMLIDARKSISSFQEITGLFHGWNSGMKSWQNFVLCVEDLVMWIQPNFHAPMAQNQGMKKKSMELSWLSTPFAIRFSPRPLLSRRPDLPVVDLLDKSFVHLDLKLMEGGPLLNALRSILVNWQLRDAVWSLTILTKYSPHQPYLTLL